jgi:hypothetical protein
VYYYHYPYLWRLHLFYNHGVVCAVRIVNTTLPES